MTKPRENVRLLEDIKGYPRTHEEVKEDGYDEAAKQNPHLETPGFVHRTRSFFNDSMYDYQAEGFCVCGSNFQVENEVPGWSGQTRAVVHLSKKNGPCTAIWPAVQRANEKVKVALERPKMYGMCCSATTRADGKTTGWGNFEGKICPVCKGVGTRPVREDLGRRWSGYSDDQVESYIADKVALIRSDLGSADKTMRTKDPWNYRLRSTATWWLREILAFVLDKAWEAEVERARAQAEEGLKK